MKRPFSLQTLAACLFGSLLLLGCRSTSPPRSTSDLDSTQAERIRARLALTPDSLASLPRPLFYQSSSPIEAEPLKRGWSPTSMEEVTVWTRGSGRSSASPQEDKISTIRTRVEAVGGIVNGKAQLGLRIQSVLPDSSSLRPPPYVDLFAEQFLLRRGQVWRTLRSERDSLYEERLVSLSVSDLQRLLQTDTVRMAVNTAHFQLPQAFQKEITALYAAIPDTLSPDTASVDTRLTVLHSPETLPQLPDVAEFGRVLDYPVAAIQQGITGRTRGGFIVHPNGSVSHLQVERHASPVLTRATLQGIQQITFDPATHHGTPVPVWTTLPVTYEIRD